jgi:hypothetical protein
MPATLAATVYHLLGVPQQQQVLDTAERPHFIRPAAPLEEILI